MKKWFIGGGITVVIIGAICLWYSYLPPNLRAFVPFVFDQQGLYEPIGTGSLDISKEGAEATIPLHPKYVSGYDVNVEFQSIKDCFKLSNLQNGILRAQLWCGNPFPDAYASQDVYLICGDEEDGTTKLSLLSFTLDRQHLQCDSLVLKLEVLKPYTNLGVTGPVKVSISSNHHL